ncbi:MAG: T9SS type A sorting domain-containing protein [candidate division Zixibacteria bacterium]|nr:T9SS type A sorting domain-containing protein [candidate division Zixibacteria bacterium]
MNLFRTTIMALIVMMLVFGGNVFADENDIVINEIMYNFLDDYDPGNEDVWFEFVELYNNGPDSVDLSDWWFRDGITFTFPTDSYILGYDYVVVALDPWDTTLFFDIYPNADSSKVFGPNSGALSNGGEDIIICNADSVAIDSVWYDDGGGWPTEPDGDGPSLELINPSSDNNIPTSWAASVDPDSFGTPTLQNSVYSVANQPPVISGMFHDPVGPGVNEVCTVSAFITDPSMAATVASADLYYDNGSGYTSVGMNNTADSFYADIPGQLEGTSVEYYISAKDDAGDSTLSETGYYYVTDIVPSFGDLTVNEICYAPYGDDGSFEYVEFYNPSDVNTVNASGWIFRDEFDANTFTIPGGTTVGPEDYLIVAINPDSFAVRYPTATCTVVGPSGVFLNNGGGDIIRLLSPGLAVVDSVDYYNGGDWPVTSNDDPSIELKNEYYNRNEGSSWALAVTPDTFGTPCAINSTWETGDETPPEMYQAHTMSNTTVKVYFNEVLDETTAENTANYYLTQVGGPVRTIYSATLNADQFTVDLVTNNTANNQQMMLLAQSIADTAGNVMAGIDTAYFRGGLTSIIVVQEPVDLGPPMNDTSNFFGEMVTVSGVVTCDSTALTSSAAYTYIEDTSHTFAYGIKIYTGYHNDWVQGDYVTVAGYVDEYDPNDVNETTVNLEWESNAGPMAVGDFGEHWVYPATAVPTSEATYNKGYSEAWEGTLVRLFNLELIHDTAGTYGNNLLFVDEVSRLDTIEMQLYPYTTVPYTTGATYTITGIMTHNYGHYIVRYRGYDDDLVNTTKPAVIAMEPIDPPVVVSSPGTFYFNGILVNTTNSAWTKDIWITVEKPGSFEVEVLTFMNVFMPKFFSSTAFNASQFVPNGAPTGAYLYHAYLGDYGTSTAEDTATFGFTIPASFGRVMGEWTTVDWRDLFNGGITIEPLPISYDLSQNYPNPFNPTTTINYQLPKDCDVTLEVYNLLGQRVATLVDGYVGAGYHTVDWNAATYSSGVYFYRLQADNFQQVKKMMLVK